VINTSDGSRNQIRQVARQVVATGDVWNGVSAGETSWSWATEAGEVSDDASTFAQPAISIHRGEGFVPISLEALQDEANVANEVARLMASGKDTLEATAFATGSGSGEPFGIVTALNGAAPPVIAATTNNQFGSPDVYLLDDALPARYRGNASWLANRAIYNDIRQFDTSGGAQLWERIGADVPPLLLGRPALEAEAMDGALATANDYVLVYGDFDHYVIADRIGTTVEFVPQLFHTTSNRPSGQKGWFAWFRVGADSVNDSAFKLLQV
jgi:HK97 family phage major capsid protein